MSLDNQNVLEIMPPKDDIQFSVFVYQDPKQLTGMVGAIYQLKSETTASNVIRFWLTTDITLLASGLDLFYAVYSLLTEVLPGDTSELGDEETVGVMCKGFFEFKLVRSLDQEVVHQFLHNISLLICPLDQACLSVLALMDRKPK